MTDDQTMVLLMLLVFGVVIGALGFHAARGERAEGERRRAEEKRSATPAPAPPTESPITIRVGQYVFIDPLGKPYGEGATPAVPRYPGKHVRA